VQIFYNIMSLYMGMKGYTGVVLQISAHVKYMMYYLLSYTVFLVVRLLQLSVICDDFKDAKVKCADIQTVFVMAQGTDFLLYSYFAFVAWSYVKKLELNPDLPRFAFEGLGIDNPMFGPPGGFGDASG